MNKPLGIGTVLVGCLLGLPSSSMARTWAETATIRYKKHITENRASEKARLMKLVYRKGKVKLFACLPSVEANGTGFKAVFSLKYKYFRTHTVKYVWRCTQIQHSGVKIIDSTYTVKEKVRKAIDDYYKDQWKQILGGRGRTLNNAWHKKAAAALIAILEDEEEYTMVMKGLQARTHPTGKAKRLYTYAAEGMKIPLKLRWKWMRKTFRTTILWHCDARGKHKKVEVPRKTDTAVVPVTRKNLKKLDEFFKKKVWPAVNAQIMGKVSLGGNWSGAAGTAGSFTMNVFQLNASSPIFTGRYTGLGVGPIGGIIENGSNRGGRVKFKLGMRTFTGRLQNKKSVTGSWSGGGGSGSFSMTRKGW